MEWTQIPEGEIAYQITPNGEKPYVTPYVTQDMEKACHVIEQLLIGRVAFRIDYVYVD